MDLVFPQTMQRMDRRTIDHVGTPSVVLMDRASRGAVETLVDHFELPTASSPLFLCGTGNNGGDGLAMATLLHHRGHTPQCILLGRPSDLSPDAAIYFQIAQQLEIPIDEAADEAALESLLDDLSSFDLLVDALLGTGLDRPLAGRYRRAVEWLQNQTTPLVAIDIPTGIDGRTGQIRGTTSRADLTTTFGFAKSGQLLDPGRAHCGKLVVIDIGIPPEVCDHIGFDALGLTPEWLKHHLPARPLDLHKGGAGRTLHVGGRPPTPGAIILSARGALVGGAGLISVATDHRSALMAPARSPEIMGQSVVDDGPSVDLDGLLALLQKADVAVVGPGLGTDDTAYSILECCLQEASAALVLDADALNLLAAHDELRDALSERACEEPVFLTPHPGEMARLQNETVPDVLQAPMAAAQSLAASTDAIVIHKTAATVVADARGSLAINRTGNPGMATGGMGDALTGLCASALCDLRDPFEAACFAVALHGFAGDRARQRTGVRGLSVEALLDEIPSIWQSLER